MDQDIEQILNSSLTIDLPLVFTTNDAQEKGDTPTPANATGAGQQGGEKKGKKRKEGGEDGRADRRVFNTSMVEEFKMKEGEDWRKHLSGKLPWGDSPNVWMCARWVAKGDCFIDCNNKACHVGADAIPPKKKDEYLNFLKSVRNTQQNA